MKMNFCHSENVIEYLTVDKGSKTHSLLLQLLQHEKALPKPNTHHKHCKNTLNSSV